MPYEPYVTPEYYTEEYGGGTVPEEKLATALRQASRHVDSLTYNRIVGHKRCIGTVWQFLERLYGQRCGNEERYIRSAVSDRIVLQVGEVIA